MLLLVNFPIVFALSSVAVTVSTQLCVICRHNFLRAVKKFLGSRLIMSSKRYSHRSHKFLRAEASRDMLK